MAGECQPSDVAVAVEDKGIIDLIYGEEEKERDRPEIYIVKVIKEI